MPTVCANNLARIIYVFSENDASRESVFLPLLHFKLAKRKGDGKGGAMDKYTILLNIVRSN